MNQPKHVLVVCQRPPFPPNKGEKLRSYYQIRYLMAQGCTVSVACPVIGSQEFEDLKALESELKLETMSEAIKAPVLEKLKAFTSGKSISESLFFCKKLKNKIDDFVISNSVDAVLMTASSLINYSNNLKTPTFMDFMDLDSDKWQQYAKNSQLPMSWLYQREAKKVLQLEKKSVEQCTEGYFISDNEIDMLKQQTKLPCINVIKIANGISSEEFYPPTLRRRGKIESDPRLVFVGVMDYKPNEDAVLWFVQSMWPKVQEKYPDATFKIVGMSPSPSIKALGEIEGITVIGKVDSVLPYFHEADIFIAPFRLARGVQNKVLQAFACELPVVTTPMGLEGISGLTQTCAVAGLTAAEITDSLCELIESPKTRSEMAEQGNRVIQKSYAWGSVLSEFMKAVVNKPETAVPKNKSEPA